MGGSSAALDGTSREPFLTEQQKAELREPAVHDPVLA